jgi:hypothetical protein
MKHEWLYHIVAFRGAAIIFIIVSTIGLTADVMKLMPASFQWAPPLTILFMSIAGSVANMRATDLTDIAIQRYGLVVEANPHARWIYNKTGKPMKGVKLMFLMGVYCYLILSSWLTPFPLTMASLAAGMSILLILDWLWDTLVAEEDRLEEAAEAEHNL